MYALKCWLGYDFWDETVNTTCYMFNLSPSTAIDCKTPNEVWSGKPAHYYNLKVFGCPTYYHVRESKIDPRSKKGYLLVMVKV